jgi:hypothetical protein
MKSGGQKRLNMKSTSHIWPETWCTFLQNSSCHVKLFNTYRQSDGHAETCSPGATPLSKISPTDC